MCLNADKPRIKAEPKTDDRHAGNEDENWQQIDADGHYMSYYVRQVNGVNGGDTVFVRCVSIMSVSSGPINQTSLC